MNKTLQLQFWNATARAYEPTTSTVGSEMHKGIETIAQFARGVSKAWRIADIERPLKPSRYVSGRKSTQRSVADVQRDYLAWAQAEGLRSVVAYKDKPLANYAADRIVGYHKKHADKSIPVFAGAIEYITADEQFHVTESTDYDARIPTLYEARV